MLKTCAYGLAAGLVAVAFQLAIKGSHLGGLVRLSQHSHTFFLWSSLGLILGTSLISGWMLNSLCPDAAGSGIPQLKAAFWKNFGYVPFRVLWVKFIAAVLQIGGGSSLGREGPSVQLAGAAGSLLAGVAGEPKQKRRLGAATGGAAGLAAAFNTPLAGVTFVLEELIGDLNSRLLGSVLIGAMLGALVAHGIMGPQPLFPLRPSVNQPGLPICWYRSWRWREPWWAWRFKTRRSACVPGKGNGPPAGLVAARHRRFGLLGAGRVRVLSNRQARRVRPWL